MSATTRIIAASLAILLMPRCGGATSFTGEDADHDPSPDAPGDALADTVADTVADVGADTVADVGADTVADLPGDPSVDGGCASDGDCMEGLSCCDSRCVNTSYDPLNCSGCRSECTAVGTSSSAICDGGVCVERTCEGVDVCPDGTYCCGTSCCNAGQICCIVEGPGPLRAPSCYDDFCPGGCPLCD